MNDSEEEKQEIHEGTEALQNIADDVERERGKDGTSEFDEPEKPEEQLMSDAAAHSEENPDIDAETSEDH